MQFRVSRLKTSIEAIEMMDGLYLRSYILSRLVCRLTGKISEILSECKYFVAILIGTN